MAIEYFKASEEIHEQVQDLVRKNHPDLFIVLEEIVVLFRSRASKSGGEPVLGKASKVSAKTNAYSRYDYVFELELAQDKWEHLSGVQQEALLDHLLMHCRVTEDPKKGEIKARIVSPDLMAFRENIERYGLWFPHDREEGGLRLQVVRDDEQAEEAA